MTITVLHVASLATLLIAGTALVHLQGSNKLQGEKIATLESAAERDAQVQAHQAAALQIFGELQKGLTEIGKGTRAINTALAIQSSVMARELQELKRNDQTVRDYLASPVPGAVGLRWQRAESTDPVTYRPVPGVQSGAVPSASSPRSVSQ